MKDVLKGVDHIIAILCREISNGIINFPVTFSSRVTFVSSFLFFRNQIDVCVISSFTRKSFL